MLGAQTIISKRYELGLDRFLPWFFLVIAWLIAFFLVCVYTCGIQLRWHFTLHGWKQEWLLEDRMKSEDYRVLDAIRAALREEEFGSHGATPSIPDYTQSVGKTYQNLVQDLVALNPAAIAIIMDGSSRGSFDGPSWVPNWQTSVPSTWLTSKYMFGVTETCTPFYSKPYVTISAFQLHLKGIAKGALTFKTSLDHRRCDDEEECLKAAFRAIVCWWAHIIATVPKHAPNDKYLSALFAILNGLSPRRGSTGTYHKEVRGPKGHIPAHWEPSPPVQGPYDFRSQEAEFVDWTELYKILEPSIPPQADATEQFLGALWQVLLPRIMASKQAKQYLIMVHNKLSNERRCLIVLCSKYLGTGPHDLVVGDELFLLGGVPVPMALRRSSSDEDENLRVVGAVMVHGIMHAEGFQKSNLREVVLV